MLYQSKSLMVSRTLFCIFISLALLLIADLSIVVMKLDHRAARSHVDTLRETDKERLKHEAVALRLLSRPNQQQLLLHTAALLIVLQADAMKRRRCTFISSHTHHKLRPRGKMWLFWFIP